MKLAFTKYQSMPKPSFSALDPVFFLQTFVLELLHACEQAGDNRKEYIEHIAHSASQFFEEAYRHDKNLQQPLDIEQYVDLILALKNHIGGNFSLASSDAKCIRVFNTRCPFGEGVTNFPDLCRMTSSVFGGIAARNFGYAKVHIAECIAKQHGHCKVAIHLDPKEARQQPGTEYLRPEESAQIREEIDSLQAKLDSKFHQLWLDTNKTRRLKGESPGHPVLVTESPPMRKVLQALNKVAPTDATVLVEGETGAGKELIAKAIHAMSARAGHPFLAINCGAIPETLIESTLFGHEKGAFTGAVDIHQGVFERAEGGTLFLDEIDSLSPAAQVRLLRILQEGELERVGGRRTLEVNVRIIAATNQDLEALIRRGAFREDLYFRILVVKLSLPPLRQREQDLPALVKIILQKLSTKYQRPAPTVSRKVMQQIRDYSWPGNVRELENVLERSFLFSEGGELTELELEESSDTVEPLNWQQLREQALDKVEKQYLIAALQRHAGNVENIANEMAITPRAVYHKLKRHGLSPSDYRVLQSGI